MGLALATCAGHGKNSGRQSNGVSGGHEGGGEGGGGAGGGEGGALGEGKQTHVMVPEASAQYVSEAVPMLKVTEPLGMRTLPDGGTSLT